LVDISNSILTGEVKADCVVCDAILLHSFSLSPKKEIRDDVAVKGGVEEGNGYKCEPMVAALHLGAAGVGRN
jgi:hypothetical protein